MSKEEFKNALLNECEKLEELKVLLSHGLISYAEYLAFFKVQFLNK